MNDISYIGSIHGFLNCRTREKKQLPLVGRSSRVWLAALAHSFSVVGKKRKAALPFSRSVTSFIVRLLKRLPRQRRRGAVRVNFTWNFLFDFDSYLITHTHQTTRRKDARILSRRKKRGKEERHFVDRVALRPNVNRCTKNLKKNEDDYRTIWILLLGISIELHKTNVQWRRNFWYEDLHMDGLSAEKKKTRPDATIRTTRCSMKRFVSTFQELEQTTVAGRDRHATLAAWYHRFPADNRREVPFDGLVSSWVTHPWPTRREASMKRKSPPARQRTLTIRG